MRVGEEKKNGWKGENFKPDERTLAEALNGRQGRFFVRVYDSDVKLLDKGEFRYLRDLREIRINSEPYTEQTVLVPSLTGHSLTKVHFIGVDGATVRPILPRESSHAEAQRNTLVVRPHLNGDEISCDLECASGRVGIVLNLPRIWWRLESDESESGDWRATSFSVTRQEFREHASANANILLRLPRRMKSVRVGFGVELERVYRHPKERNDIQIPLADFFDYSQVDQRLNEDASFNVDCSGAVLTLIRISADPVPTIIYFTSTPETVGIGEQATLRWETRNAEADGVVIDPEMGAVEPSGSLTVVVPKMTTYTLRLTASGMDDVTRAVTVTIAGEKPFARVRSVGGGWKRGKGFSYCELRSAGLTVVDARRLLMSVDKRRRTKHRANVETIRRLIDA